MPTDDGNARPTAAGPPVLFIADGDAEARAVTESALARRFGSDYRVLAADTAQGGLEALRDLAGEGDDVALVAADLRLPDTDGMEFLERAHALHPQAARVLLVAMDQHHTRMPFSELATLQRLPRWGGSTSRWSRAGPPRRNGSTRRSRKRSPPGHSPTGLATSSTGSSVEQWAPRSHELRDLLARNGVPFTFYAADSAAGQQLIDEFRVDARRLPAVDPPRWFGPARSQLRGSRSRPRHPDPALWRGLRPCHRGGRTGRAGRGRLWRLRRAAHHRSRTPRDRRAGRDKLDDPQLPRVPAGHQRRRIGAPGLGASRALRRRVCLHPGGDRAQPGAATTA